MGNTVRRAGVVQQPPLPDGLLNPRGVIAVAVENDPLVFANGIADQALEGGFEILRPLQLIGETL